MSEPNESRAATGPIGRWLTHWSFWPVYVVVVLLLIWVLRPWDRWAGESGVRGVEIHDELPTNSVHHPVRSVLITHPVGSVLITTAAATAQEDSWQLCDGHAVSTATFPGLSNIGLKAGPEDGSVAMPDLSGLWIWSPKEKQMRGIESFLHFGSQDREETPREVIRFWIRAR